MLSDLLRGRPKYAPALSGVRRLAFFMAFFVAAPSWSLVVNSEADVSDGDLGDDVCDTGNEVEGFTGECTLRAALANAGQGETITFAPGVSRIVMSEEEGGLPLLRASIDGGADKVEISGSGPTAASSGIVVSAVAAASPDPLFIRNLVLNRFPESGIVVSAALENVPRNVVIENCFIGTDRDGSATSGFGNGFFGIQLARTIDTTIRNCVVSDNESGGIIVATSASGAIVGTVIQGCKIGTDATGTQPLGNRGTGISLGNFLLSATDTLVGGTGAGEGNVVSANAGHGISVQGETFQGGNRIIGNMIGTDVSGSFGLGNGGSGVFINMTHDVRVGGINPGEGNVISANGENGVTIDARESDGHILEGNRIGTDLSGEEPLGNALNGVLFSGGTINNRVGGDGVAPGSCDGPCNVIAYNGEDAVAVIENSAQNAVRANRIRDNGALGIDLDNDGPTLNDDGDADEGGNRLLNFPLIETITVTNGQTTVEGRRDINFNPPQKIDFYANELCDASGFGEGATYLGTVELSSDSNFSVTFDGEFRNVTATMTDAAGNTSEFSPCGEILTINTVGDAGDNNPGDGVCWTGATLADNTLECTLRAGIEEANADPNHTILKWGIRDDAGQLLFLPEITPASPLPDIVETFTLDGSTQIGEIVTTAPRPFSPGGETQIGQPGGIINGQNLPHVRFAQTNGTLQNIAFIDFPPESNAVFITDLGGVTVKSCWFGVDPRNGEAAINRGNNLQIINAPDNVIGSSMPGEGNLISRARESGVVINGESSTNNRVIGNFIGTDAAGDAFLDNNVGVLIIDASNNFIGGPTSEPGRAPGNLISGNRVLSGLRDEGIGVLITHINGSANGNRVRGNLIGLNFNGDEDLRNTSGVVLRGNGSQDKSVSGNVIGGPDAQDRNVITANSSNIRIDGDNVDENFVQGNFIGTRPGGLSMLGGLGGSGVTIEEGDDNLIGGGAEEPGRPPGNIVSDNVFGISLRAGAERTRVEGNLVGLAKGGAFSLPNRTGISVSGADDSVIGGETADKRNIVSGNEDEGIVLGVAAEGVLIQGNYIGLDSTGKVAVANDEGILIEGGDENVIGGNVSEIGEPPGNVIAGNKDAGIRIENTGMNQAEGNLVLGNLIGMKPGGSEPLGNEKEGIAIIGSSDNLIGVTSLGGAVPNVISANGRSGVRIRNDADEDLLASNNTVLGNLIGVDRSGMEDRGNGRFGVRVETAGPHDIVRNVIAYNKRSGVGVDNGTPLTGQGTSIAENFIFANGELGIDLEEDGVTLNDAGDDDFGANGRQNFPVLTGAEIVAGNIRIQGTLNSEPNASYRLEFFANTGCDGSGHGEGRIPLTNTTVTTDGNGDLSDGPFSIEVPDTDPPASFVAATASKLAGLQEVTSEFSECFQVQGPDRDGDGVDDRIEDANPGGGGQGRGALIALPGDGNGDGTPDSDQPNVASFPSAADGRYVTIETPVGTILQNTAAVDPNGLPIESFVPFGFFRFQIADDPEDAGPNGLVPGGDVAARVLLPELDLSELSYFKFGKKPTFPADRLFEFAFDGQTGAVVGEGEMTLQFIDGELGDVDIMADGVVSDPGGPAAIVIPENAARGWQRYR